MERIRDEKQKWLNLNFENFQIEFDGCVFTVCKNAVVVKGDVGW